METQHHIFLCLNIVLTDLGIKKIYETVCFIFTEASVPLLAVFAKYLQLLQCRLKGLGGCRGSGRYLYC